MFFKGAHFACMPPELAERCIKAGTSERGSCAACGAPLVRVVERGESSRIGPTASGWREPGRDHAAVSRVGTASVTTTGWHPSCACAAATVPATVLDPFAGASTTLLVAERLQRRSIGVELSPAYVAMGAERLRADAPLFAGAAA